MSCPVCNTPNSAMSVRCIQCGTTLIHEAAGRSTMVRQAADSIDGYMYSGFGALLGFVASTGSWLVLSGDETEMKAFSIVGVTLGAVAGKVLLWKRNRTLS